jgi:hypothetical protein
VALAALFEARGATDIKTVANREIDAEAKFQIKKGKSNLKSVIALCACAFLLIGIAPVQPTFAQQQLHYADSVPAFSNATILIIRHAEKVEDGSDLSPVGYQHANQYVHYFENYKIDGQPIHIDAIYSTKDSAESARTRLTVTPLSQALKLPINSTFKNKNYDDLAATLQTEAVGKTIVICWHHSKIPGLLTALGADANTLVPGGIWPEEQYDWVIQLCYDKDGHLIPSKTERVTEVL